MILDRVICADSRRMEEVDSGSVHLVVTSPPYNVGTPYDEHLDSLPSGKYLELLNAVWKECVRVLCDGGRLCVNVANVARKPYLPLHSVITRQLADLGLLMRGEIIWNKGMSARSSMRWGSWKLPTDPVLREVHEYILVFSKNGYRLPAEGTSDITKEEFLEYTRSLATFPPASAKRIGHPAPFPERLPARLMKLFTFPGNVVLDPFLGSGTTAVAAKRLGRHFIGYDISENYCQLARKRVAEVDFKLPSTKRD